MLHTVQAGLQLGLQPGSVRGIQTAGEGQGQFGAVEFFSMVICVSLLVLAE
jgi:hypothetical protein